MSQTRNLDSSLLTKIKGSRTVFANNLAQNAAVNAGRRLAVTAVSGSGSDNSFTTAINTGSVNLTPAEYEAAIEAGSGSGPGPAPAPAPQVILFSSSPSTLPNSSFLPGYTVPGYTVPAGYTSITFVLIGRGGIGASTQDNSGGGGGAAGQILTGTLSITEGEEVSIQRYLRPTGYMAPSPSVGITIGDRTITAESGGDGNGIYGGSPSDATPDTDITVYNGNFGGDATGLNGGNGGALSILSPVSSLPFGGGGGGGAAPGGSVGLGVNGGINSSQGFGGEGIGGNGGSLFYAIQLTPAGYTGPNLFSRIV